MTAGVQAYVMNATSVDGEKFAVFRDVSADAKLHQMVLLENQSGGGDPVIIGAENPLQSQLYGLYRAALPPLTEGAIAPAALDISGRLLVNVDAGTLDGIADNGALFTIGSTAALPSAMIVGLGAAAPTAGNLAIPCMTVNRQQRVVLDLDTAGGLTMVPYVAPAVPAPFLVKAGPGQLAFCDMFNKLPLGMHLKFFDAASTGAVTMGGTAAFWETGIPGNVGGAGRTFTVQMGIPFVNGLVVAVTADFGPTDNSPGTLAVKKVGVGFGIK